MYEIGRLTTTNHDTVRRYMSSGKVSVRFFAAFCAAFEVDPRWLLTGNGRPSRRND